MRRDLLTAIGAWVVVTAITAVAISVWDPWPTQGSEEAEFLDEAFLIMTYMAAPVFGLVVALLVYSIARYATWERPVDEGEGITGEDDRTRWVPRVWILVSSALAITVMIFPGLTGLAHIREDGTHDLEINVQAVSWQWLVHYPDTDIRVSGQQEMVLPLDTRIRFNVEALDVLHSFWIPAFREKIDAVPGTATEMYITPIAIGDGHTDAAFRIQCAELCGLQHSTMSMPVRVVERAEFDAWVREHTATAARPAVPEGR